MEIERYLEVGEERALELVLVNRSAPAPVRSMVEDLFADQPVGVSETEEAGSEDDMVYLFEGGTLVAKSSLQALLDSILLVNSDLFISGSGSFEDVGVPAVIDALTDTRFSLQGYPESNSEKLLLILLSRYIERLAFEAGEGTLRVAFQRLSRLRDEEGTMTVYQQLAGTDLDVHLYGVPDWIPPRELDAIVHGGYGSLFSATWFVLFEPATRDHESAGLLAIEEEPRKWESVYSYDEDLVADIAGHVESTM